MPPKTSAQGEKAEKTFTLDTVAVLVSALEEHGVIVSTKHYKLMSSLDGKRGPDAFQHDFRVVKKRAAELSADAHAGKVFAPVKKSKAPSGKSAAIGQATPTSTPSKKRVRAGITKQEASNNDGDDEKPAKIIKQEPGSEPKEDSDLGFGDLPEFGAEEYFASGFGGNVGSAFEENFRSTLEGNRESEDEENFGF
ncbi:MAG: hypothetical protein M1822_000157 [Bathelium mastoideum]|nr:MAG: hypothetical protein M1822_000157 [Bathelium mastoideum]